MEKAKIYECESLALMPYLEMNGLHYIGCRAAMDENRARIVAQFEDPRGIGQELAMSWNNSSEKKYRDYWLFFRNEIDRAIKDIK